MHSGLILTGTHTYRGEADAHTHFWATQLTNMVWNAYRDKNKLTAYSMMLENKPQQTNWHTINACEISDKYNYYNI